MMKNFSMVKHSETHKKIKEGARLKNSKPCLPSLGQDIPTSSFPKMLLEGTPARERSKWNPTHGWITTISILSDNMPSFHVGFMWTSWVQADDSTCCDKAQSDVTFTSRNIRGTALGTLKIHATTADVLMPFHDLAMMDICKHVKYSIVSSLSKPFSSFQ